MRPTQTLGTLLAIALPAASGAADWPQWRGPGRDGHAAAASSVDWAAAPRKLWSIPVGTGHSGPVVSGGRIVQHVHSAGREVVVGLDLATGREVWRDSYPVAFDVKPEARDHGVGPFATPAIADGRAFTFGITEVLTAYDLATGRVLWRHDWSNEFATPHPLYGSAVAPLVDGQNLIVYVGGPGRGALVAHDVRTGAVRWRLDGEGPSYSAPVVGTIGGARQIVTLTQDHVMGVDARTGARLWRHPFPVSYDQTVVTPLIVDERVLVSGYDVDLQALAPRKGAAGWTVEVAWRLRQPMYMSSAVIADGRAYGLTHLRKGQLFAANPATGRTLWASEPGVGESAVLVVAGPNVLALTTEGDLRVFAAGDAYRALARHRVSDSPVWAAPAVIDGGRMLVKGATTLTLWAFSESKPAASAR
jgi:outer membrane protein assembly factor BamB